MRKLRSAAALLPVALVCLLLAACTRPSFEFDADEAVARAKVIVELAGARDYGAIWELLPEDLQTQLPADDLEAAWGPVLDGAGAFVAYKNADATGITQSGVDYIVVVLSCTYENATHIYTISFTTDMEPAGLFLK